MIASLIYCSRGRRTGDLLPANAGLASRDSRERECSKILGERLTVFAVEEVAHGFAAGSGDFKLGATLDGIGGRAGLRLGGFFRLAAGGAAIGEAGLAGAKLEFLVTDDAGFDREGHARIC